MKAYSKSRHYVQETFKNFKRRYGSVRPESPMFYSTKLPTGIKRSHDEIMNDSDEEMGKEIVESCFLQTDRSAEGLDLKQCVLLDSESSAHTFCNANLLENIWSEPEKLTLKGNGGDMITYQQGSIKNLSMEHPVWYHPDFIANILSLALIKDQFRVTYDSDKGGVFEVHIPGKSSLYFPCYSNGLHILECSSEGFSFVETIAENKKGYSKRQIHNAERVEAFIETIGNPSERDLRTLVRSGAILNCPITIEDLDIYYLIFKKNILALKGNTTRKKPDKQNTSVIKYQHGYWINTPL